MDSVEKVVEKTPELKPEGEIIIVPKSTTIIEAPMSINQL
jgi:hypothetical protein